MPPSAPALDSALALADSTPAAQAVLKREGQAGRLENGAVVQVIRAVQAVVSQAVASQTMAVGMAEEKTPRQQRAPPAGAR